MKIGIHLVHPLEKLLVREETKQQRMRPECQRRVDRNVLPHAADTSAAPGAAILQSESSDQNKESMTDHQLCWELSDASAMDLAPVWLET